MLTLDGSQGEGGGQILRTSLALSMCTGMPFRIERIRASRTRPGLMRQHLAAVLAASEVSSARVTGAQIGSQTLTFAPDRIRGGEYRFATGSAGSCTLVLQTILPALLHAPTASTVTLQGGTHNPMAPPYPFLERAFAPVLRRMGANMTLKLGRHGFYPAGGGEVVAVIEPVGTLGVIDLRERGERVNAYAESLMAALAENIAQRELAAVSKALGWNDAQLFERNLPRNEGPGNSLHVTLVHRNVTEVFSAFGEIGVTSEAVAKQVIDEVRRYLASDGAVGGHLADQLLVPMALAGGGTFTTSEVTPHTRTNAEVIGRFLPVETDIVASGGNAYTVTMRRRQPR
jgi:RNA 3'-terminal phosphate cyclase (ATP)